MIALLAGIALAARVGGQPNRPDWRWTTLETEHFDVHYPTARDPGVPVAAQATAERAAVLAEGLWTSLAQSSGYWPRTRIDIVIRDDGDALAGHSIPPWHQVVISVSVGEDLQRARGRGDPLELILAHELGHVFTHAAAAAHAPSATVGPEVGGVGSVDVGPELVVGGALRLTGNPPSGWSEGTAELTAEDVGVATWTAERDATIRIAALDGALPTWTELQLAPEADLWGVGERRYQAAYAWARSVPDWHAVSDAAARRYRLSWRGALDAAGGRAGYEAWIASATAGAEARREALARAGLVEGLPTEGEPKDGSPANTAWWPRISPDGRWRADERGSWLGITPTGGGESRWIRAFPAGGYAFVPGADRVIAAFEHRPGAPDRRYGWSRLYAVDLADPAAPLVEIPGTLRASAPAVSPDGTRLAWLRSVDGARRVVVADLDGGNPRELETPDGARLSGLSWSPDGTRLVTAAGWRGSQELWEIPADGGPARALTDDALVEDDPWWAPDGSILFVADVDGIFDVFRLDPAGHRVTRLTRVVGAAATPSLDPDGTLRYSAFDRTGWRPYAIPASDLLSDEEPAFGLDPVPRGPAPSAEPVWTVRRYSPLRASLPMTVVPLLRIENAGYPVADDTLRPRAGAWLQATDAVEDHHVDLLALLGSDLVVAGGYTLSRFRPDLSLNASRAERHGTDGPEVAVDRGSLAMDLPVVGPLAARAAAEVADWRGIEGDGRGFYASAGLSATDRRADASAGVTRAWTDATVPWDRVDLGVTGRLHPRGTPDDHRFELGATGAFTDRPTDAANQLHAGGDHPYAWYTAALQTSARFPGFAPYALAGDELAVATAGWQVPLAHDRAVALGPVIGQDLLLWLGGDAGDAWAHGGVPALRGDLVGDVRWRATLAGAPWDGLVRAAWAPGEDPRIYLSLGGGW